MNTLVQHAKHNITFLLDDDKCFPLNILILLPYNVAEKNLWLKVMNNLLELTRLVSFKKKKDGKKNSKLKLFFFFIGLWEKTDLIRILFHVYINNRKAVDNFANKGQLEDYFSGKPYIEKVSTKFTYSIYF